MTARLLTNQDARVLGDYLSGYKTECMFILSNLAAAGVDYKGAAFQGEYFGFFHNEADEAGENHQLSGVIVHYWNGNVMMCVSNKKILESLAHCLINNISRPIAGILGPNSQAEYVIEKLGLTEVTFNINSNESLYELNFEAFKKPDLPTGFDVVRTQDVPREILLKWMQAYDAEALGVSTNNDSDGCAEHDSSRRLEQKDIWVLLLDGVPVSLSGFNARIEDMVQVGPVWTPPEHRNKHFARMLLAHTLFEEKRKGIRRAILFTNNPHAVKAYFSIGFKKIGYFRLALLKKSLNLDEVELIRSQDLS